MIKYFIYVRKSQDRSDRQIMSIQGQIDAIKKFAKAQGFVIVEIFIEQKSAKKPGRPIFNEMIERLEKGEANGILCWKLNRLARNPKDAGTISWMLQTNVIQAIHSHERSYLPTDNVLMMQLDFGIANQFIKDLSSDVKRGMRDKADSGWMPQSVLPIGYLHDPRKQNTVKQIIKDPIRFPMIKELWKLMETGAYSVMDIKKLADQMGLHNRNKKPYVLSTFYLMFKNPMYYGKFYWKDEHDNKVLWQGKHEAMISEETFRRVQQLITLRNRNSRPQRLYYTYRGLITCGECNGHVSAERKLQAICTNCKHKYSIISNEICRKCNTPLSQMKKPRIVERVYYRCTRQKNTACRQKAMSESAIDKEIVKVLQNISIPSEMYNYLKKYIHEYAHNKHDGKKVLVDSLKKKSLRIKDKIKKLIDLLISNDISKEEASIMKETYNTELAEIEQKIFEKENALSIDLTKNQMYLNFAQNCIDRFNKGNQSTKKELTAFFCSNLKIFNKSLYFSTKKAPEGLSYVHQVLLPFPKASNLKIR